MPLASTIMIWREIGNLCSRLTTNARKEKVLAKLEAFGLLQSVQEIHAFFGDRAAGGNGYDLVWKTTVTWDDLRAILPKV